MKHGSDEMPVACCLTTAELREREATLLAQFRSAVIAAERQCCPCFTFELVAQPSMRPTSTFGDPAALNLSK